jgi:hypothetical protein
MTGTNHGMTGALIALTVKNPAAAVPLAIVSHFVQDVIPHWNFGVSRDAGRNGSFFTRRFNGLLIADFLIAATMMVILGFVFPDQKWRIWICMIAAASPDLMWAYYRLYLEHIKKRQPHFDPLARFHIFVQWSQTNAGLLVEVIWFIAAWLIILQFR